MAGEATVADVLESLNSRHISLFVERVIDDSVPIAFVDLEISPHGMSFTEQNLWASFKKECQKWKKNGNRQPPGARTPAEKFWIWKTIRMVQVAT